ncbi:ComF family protein [Streptomyces sp. 8N706]|uniref:ComF family protein n=1 Tax=Streptomyces sp. 8N706 TaxID=3457416 RepID=UPI003FD6908F
MRGWWQEISGLVMPVGCAGCGLPRAALCGRCRTALGGARPRRVRPTPLPAVLPPVHAVAPYADEVRAVLLAHKERGALGLARPLGEALAGAVRACAVRACAVRAACAGPGPLVIVPVPSARRAVAARGHDPTRRIAFAAAVRLRREGRPARVAPVLRQSRAVADQAGLTARQRHGNLAGALAVAEGGDRLLSTAPVVLVDDLMTTGATLVAAAEAVGATGVRVTAAAVIAAPLTAF